jgi:hypothetical protein
MKFTPFLFALALGALPLRAEILDAPAPEAVTTFSCDYPDNEVRRLLRDIADKFELNVVIPDSLHGRTSLKLRDVTWQQAFKAMLEPIGWTYEIDGRIVQVKPKNPPPAAKATEPMPNEFMAALSGMQSSMAKTLLRDKEYAEALAEFHWNFYSALLKKGFTKEQALKIVVASGIDGQASE